MWNPLDTCILGEIQIIDHHIHALRRLDADPLFTLVAKVGGLQSQGVKVLIVVGYIDTLTTQDLKSSGFPVVLGRSSKSEAQRVNNMEKSTPSFLSRRLVLL